MFNLKRILPIIVFTLVLGSCSSYKDTSLQSESLDRGLITSDSTKSFTDRDELVNILINTFALEDYLDMSENINRNIDKTFSNCIASDKTYINTKSSLQRKIKQTIEPLSDEEVVQYLDFMRSNEISLFQNYYRSIYSIVEGSYLDDNTSIISLYNFMQNLDDQERQSLKSISKLPNEDVRTILFPLDIPNINLTLTGEFISSIKEAVESNCQ